MRANLVALAGLLVISGCAGNSPEGAPLDAGGAGAASADPNPQTTTATDVPVEEAPPTSVADTGPKALYFEQTFGLIVTHVYIPASGAPGQSQQRYNYDANCVGFGKDQVWLVLNGTAEATWSNPGPFAQKMTVDIRDIALMATNNGSASPSLLDYGRFQTVPNALLGLWFIVQPTDPGVVLQQPVSLKIAFHYLGVPDLKTVVEPCVYTATFEDDATGVTA